MTRVPILRLAARSFSAQAQPAAAAAASVSKNSAIATTVLQNKTLVAALDNNCPVARISVAYKAGSRNEPLHEEGLTHHLRIIAGNSTSRASTFAITRNIQQYGANLTASVDREISCFTLEVTKDFLDNAVNYLTDVASRTQFWPWEVKDVLPRVKYETAGLTKQVRTLDLLHKAAYRRGLGNSLFCAPRKIGAISPESFQHYVATHFGTNRCAVSAVGIPLERAIAIAQTLDLQTANAVDTASPYKGGENRKEMGGELAHVAIAIEGVSLSNTKDALALAVLSRAMATGPQVKWGADNSPLSKAIGKELSGAPFAANGFNISYSDNGLFGVMLSVQGDLAGKAVQVAGKMLKSGLGSIGAEALKKGRAQLQLEILAAGESAAMSENMAIQGVLTGAVPSPTEVADMINRITDSDIANVASKISKGKMSMGAAGALNLVPYIDEIQ